MGISIARRRRCGSGRDAEDGNLEGYPLELFEWGMAIDLDVGTSPRCHRQVPPQDRRPSIHRDLFESYVLAAAMA